MKEKNHRITNKNGIREDESNSHHSKEKQNKPQEKQTTSLDNNP